MKIYFVHIPKNAGNSIRLHCKNMKIKVISHNLRKKRKRLLGSFRRKKPIHAFCVSRNPYERIVSAYFYMLKSESKDDQKERDIYVTQYKDFRDFVRYGLKKASDNQIHFRPQVFWILNNQGIPEIETVLRIETLQSDFDAFCKNMGLQPARLEIVNQSEHKDWEIYYDEELKDIVSGIYHADFEFFNYEK